MVSDGLTLPEYGEGLDGDRPGETDVATHTHARTHPHTHTHARTHTHRHTPWRSESRQTDTRSYSDEVMTRNEKDTQIDGQAR